MTHPTDALRPVPLEPTWDQLVAMRDCCAELSGIEADSETMLTALYRAALKAAPASPLPGGGQLPKNLGELKSPDLDALEKLADEASMARGLWDEIHCLNKFHDHADPATIKALIAELREARGLLQAMTACSSDYLASGSELARSCKEGMWGEILTSSRAFLARNGKGEG
jgi:hypothetical protein